MAYDFGKNNFSTNEHSAVVLSIQFSSSIVRKIKIGFVSISSFSPVYFQVQ
jgi:hypothetical protein